MVSRDLVFTINKEDLPPSWTLATISDLAGKHGVFVDGDWVESKDQDPNGDVRLIQLADIGDGVYRNKSHRFLTQKKAIELGCTFLKKGDVLVARMPDPLGRACIFPGDVKKSVTVVDVAIVRPKDEEFDARWLMYFINAPIFRNTVASMESGSTRKRISRKNLSKILLPVPPDNIQKLIVAEIEKQFSRLDEAVAALKRIKANLKRYKASVLKAAVEGKLTEEWRKENCRGEAVPRPCIVNGKNRATHRIAPTESGADLLKRILTERRKKCEKEHPGKKYKEPAEPDISNLPELPTGWVWATVESLSTKVVDGVHKKPSYVAQGIPFVTVKNLTAGPGISLKNLHYITLEDHTIFCRRANPKRGDILVSKDGTLGVIRLINIDTVFSIFVSVAMIKPVFQAISHYMVYALESPQVQRQMVPKGSGLQHIHLEDLRADCIPLAPLSEQEFIIAEVERYMSFIDELTSLVETNLKRAERLRQSILKKAFEGKLI